MATYAVLTASILFSGVSRATPRLLSVIPLGREVFALSTLIIDAVTAPWAPSPESRDSKELRDWLRSAVRRVARDVLRLRLRRDDAADPYAARLWRALETHFAKRNIQPQSVNDVKDLVAKLERGELHYGQVRENVVVDVLVALGLEQNENEAAKVFQTNYMPIVRYHADRFAGQRGVDAVENLAADLVLPRRNRPPKIATYRGLTPLKSWLRSVVVNQCVGAHRSQREESIGDTVEFAVDDTVQSTAFVTDCEEKLTPAFREAVGRLAVVDRVLLKMLILDGVPQKALAKTQGVDSGTLTRRRQRAAGKLLEEIQQIGNSGAASQPVNECIELLLAGNTAELQTRLATLLASQFQSQEEASQGGPQS